MGSSQEKVVAVIMVGGPTKGTRFRPLSLNVPKPLFPLAGQPMVHHPISACKRIPNLVQIYLIGFYEEREFALYVSSISNELRVPVRYLREDKPHGSAGGIYNFKDRIMEDSPSHIFLLNCDVCCSFPLPDMLVAHKKYGGIGTILVSKVSAESASQFGELVADHITNELLHYTEKPETFVSDLINCGVYIFTPDIFAAIRDVSAQRKDRANLRRVSSFDFESLQSGTKTIPSDFVRLDQDILSPLAGKRQLYTYETLEFWEANQDPGVCMVSSSFSISFLILGAASENDMAPVMPDLLRMSLKCSGLYLSQFRCTSPHLLIGPNVSISANAHVGAGARLISCIILDDVDIRENAVVIHSIVGWKSSIGKWSDILSSDLGTTFIFLIRRVCSSALLISQGEGDYNAKLGITILGEAVDVEDEIVVINSIVLPNKTLNISVQEEIIL
ncbi:unnamed protein product [Spirodela intermedia]|uniref:Uncharacterized protein n=1 Tax=Spirodela intermedia TaxID=51605 RepID=A0A7I8IYM2_SPIIN|nr:unnamed protein product [Spirodela intermedia]CAA6662968.1 unnamed protein product [Spirodela intermedia]